MAVVAEATLRENIYSKLFTLINANKLTGWTILSSFPEVSPTYPCIVINPADNSISLPTISGGVREHAPNVLIDIYALASDKKKKIDQGKDNVANTIISNQSSLRDSDGLILREDGIEDGINDAFVRGNQKINHASIILRFYKI